MRFLNQKLPDVSYLLPKIHDIINEVGSLRGPGSLYTTIDIKDSYFRFRIPEADRNWTAFMWKEKHFRFTCAPFGIKTMASQFQMVMDKILAEVAFAICYIDDIVVFSNNREQYIEHAKAVIDRLTEYSLPVRVDKSRFAQKMIRLLGFVISGAGVQMDASKVESILAWPKPKTVKQLLRFLGAANFYRQFMKDFSSISAPLDAVRKHKGELRWTERMEAAFEKWRQGIASGVILAHPDSPREYIIGTDASDFGLGAWIAQKYNNELKTLCFASRSLSKSERKHSATNKELLAIVWAIGKFQAYIAGRKFTVRTDHKALTYMFSQKNVNHMMIKWFDTLMEPDFEVVHVSGSSNLVADGLSRNMEGTSLQNMTVDHLVRDKNNPLNETHKMEILAKAHSFGNFGEHEVFRKLWKDGWWWSKMRDDIKAEISRCAPCLRYDVLRSGYHPLKSITAQLPWDHIAIDLLNPLPVSDTGMDTLLVVSDIMTRFVILPCLSSKKMDVSAREFWNIFSILGVPKIIHSDNGTDFVKQMNEELTKLNGINNRFISAYNPRANGAVERTNATIQNVLKKEVEGAMHDWPDYVPFVRLSFNCKTSALTGATPFSLMFGRSLNNFEKYGRTKKASNDSLILWEKGRRSWVTSFSLQLMKALCQRKGKWSAILHAHTE